MCRELHKCHVDGDIQWHLQIEAIFTAGDGAPVAN
jgi:hypothetical protein